MNIVGMNCLPLAVSPDCEDADDGLAQAMHPAWEEFVTSKDLPALGSAELVIMKSSSYSSYRFPPDLIGRAVWLYLRFTRSYRDVEEGWPVHAAHHACEECDSIAALLLSGIRIGSAAGMLLKVSLPGGLDRIATVLYLPIGWSGVMASEAVFGARPGATLCLLVSAAASARRAWPST